MQEKVEIITNHFENFWNYWTKILKNGYCALSMETFSNQFHIHIINFINIKYLLYLHLMILRQLLLLLLLLLLQLLLLLMLLLLLNSWN